MNMGLIIIGAGSGGRTVCDFFGKDADVAWRNKYEIEGFLDDNIELQNREVAGYRVLGTSKDLDKFKGCYFVVTLGVNLKARNDLFQLALKAGLTPATLIHESAIVARSASIGLGTIVLTHCVIGSSVKIGNNVFLFNGVLFEHDSLVSDNVYFSPGVCIAGNVTIGKNTFLGINSCVVQGIKIGENVIVGAGAAVIKDVPDNVVIAGVPANILRGNCVW